MSTMEREGAVKGAEFVSFYQEGMAVRIVHADEERLTGRVGLLPLGQEAAFLGDDYNVQSTDAAITKLVNYYQRFADTQQHIARLGKRGLGMTMSLHEEPVSYAVLAIEEPASYHRGTRHPGLVRCVIDVLEGAATGEGQLAVGRYFERHPYEDPTDMDTSVKAEEFSPFDFAVIKRAGELAVEKTELQSTVSDKIAQLVKVS